MAATAPVAKSRKPAYRPRIKIVDRAKGLYTVQSERYTHVLYLVDVVQGRCECPGSSEWGRLCKHLKVCMSYHDAIERSRQAPAPPIIAPIASPAMAGGYGKAAGLLEAFGVQVAS